MRFSRTTEYALRALALMAREPGRPRSSSDLHRELGIPKKYLQGLLTALTRHGLIQSIRGRAGGYVVARPLGQIALVEIVDAVEGFDPSPQCFFGFGRCPLDRPCAMHEQWARHQRSLTRTLTRTSLADLVLPPRRRPPSRPVPSAGSTPAPARRRH